MDQDGYVLDEILPGRRHTKAAKRLLIRLLRRQGAAPRRMVTGKLKSYAAAKRRVMPGVRHLSHQGLNNRTENSHLPLRKRERILQRFRSPGHCQQFVAVFSAVRNLFVPPRSIDAVLGRHIHRVRAFAQGNAVTALGAWEKPQGKRPDEPGQANATSRVIKRGSHGYVAAPERGITGRTGQIVGTMARPTPAEDILAFAQQALTLAPVIILGSGASAAHSIPGIWPLAGHLNALPGVAGADVDEGRKWAEFRGRLAAGDDLETALGSVRLSTRQTAYVAVATRSFLLPSDEVVLKQALSDRHCLPLARLYRHLFTSTQRTIDVVTPNYDRIAEYAADAAGYAHFSGFTTGYLETRLPGQAPGPSQGRNDQRTVCVWKVHGSLDWFE